MPKFATHKVILIHIPKCGGTSIEAAFLNRDNGKSGVFKQAWMGDYADDYHDKCDLPYKGARQHLRYSEILKLGLINEQELIRNWTTLAFIRDPWDRFMSALFFLHRGMPYAPALIKCKSRKEVIRLIKGLVYGADGIWIHGWTWDDFVKKKDHFRTQLSHIKHNGGIAVDFLGRFERFNEDFNEFLIKFNLNKKFYDKEGVGFLHDFSKAPNFVLPKAIPKKGGVKMQKSFIGFKEQFKDMGINNYKDLYDDELRELVETTYKEDIEAFGYTF